ncbi:MAG: trypsin-like serine protease [Myxococcota bacterium]
MGCKDIARGTLACVLLTMSLGCSTEVAPDSVSGTSSPIIGGMREVGTAEVVAILRDTGGGSVSICSGTAIGTRAVLTAKHCVYDGTQAIAASEFEVTVGRRAFEPGVDRRVGVDQIFTTPGPFTRADLAAGMDVAVLRTNANLNTPVREVSPAPPRVGNPLEIFGFGLRTATGDPGQKSRGTTTVVEAFAPVFVATGASNICGGDSGGPAFDSIGRVVGIANSSVDECTVDAGLWAVAGNHIALMEMANGGPLTCTVSAEVCDGADNDCDGIVDQGCRGTGETCAAQTDCASGRCEPVNMEFRCVQPCDPTIAQTGCAESFVCEISGCGEGRCVPGTAGTEAEGTACTADSDCVSNYCFEQDSGERICARQCQAGGSTCGTGLICDAGVFPCGGCRVPDPAEPQPFGTACTDAAGCESARCANGICTTSCENHDGCPAGYRCLGDVCEAGTPTLPGEACSVDAECSLDAPRCATVDGVPICATPCELGCGMGFTCENDVCVEAMLEVGTACTEGSECRSGLCAETCREACATDSECGAGFLCLPIDDGSACIEAPPVSEGGCATAPAPTPGLTLGIGFGVLGLILLGHRARR